MVRSGARRIEKFNNKLDGDAAKERTDAYRDSQAKHYSMTTKEQVQIEEFVKEFMAQHGLPVLHTNYYILFAKQIFTLLKKHGDLTFLEELEILQQKWSMRGLDFEMLNLIKLHFAPSYIIPTCFKLDISLLDGPDVLC